MPCLGNRCINLCWTGSCPPWHLLGALSTLIWIHVSIDQIFGCHTKICPMPPADRGAFRFAPATIERRSDQALPRLRQYSTAANLVHRDRSVVMRFAAD